MRQIIFLVLLTMVFIVGCTEPSVGVGALTPTLTDRGSAPELTNTEWFNTDAPLRLKDLRGKVVLLEMWTFGCYNCVNVIPYLKTWHEDYSPDGLVIIANHYPEFDYEANLSNLEAAIKEMELPYAVAVDNHGVTWRAYGNRYWPTLYLIDKKGYMRYIHIGEGAYAETEAAIEVLLSELHE